MESYICTVCGTRIIIDNENNTRDIKTTLKWNGIPKCELYKMANIVAGTFNGCIIEKI